MAATAATRAALRTQERELHKALTPLRSKFSAGNWKHGRSNFNYRVFVPENYSSTQPKRLLLFLHGAGEAGEGDNEYQLVRTPLVLAQDSIQSKYPHIIVAPYLKSSNTKPADIISMVKQVQSQHGADLKELFITGFSMGSILTWKILYNFPGFFKKAVPIAGGLPQEKAAADQPPKEPIKVQTGVWALHADDDEIVAHTSSINAINALKDVGDQAFYTNVAGGGHIIDHMIWSEEYGVLDWLFGDKPPSQKAEDKIPLPPEKVPEKAEEFGALWPPTLKPKPTVIG